MEDMFLEFQKITTSSQTNNSPIIVNSNTIISINEDELENKEIGGFYIVTRIEIAAFPKYAFFTRTSLSDVLTYIQHSDTTSSNTGNTTCADGSIIFIPTIDHSFIKTEMFFNYTITESVPYVFNPNFLVYAESTIFNDKITYQQEKGLMISLRDSTPKNILTKLTYQQIFDLLHPIQIP
jgi:hypothetical protein